MRGLDIAIYNFIRRNYNKRKITAAIFDMLERSDAFRHIGIKNLGRRINDVCKDKITKKAACIRVVGDHDGRRVGREPFGKNIGRDFGTVEYGRADNGFR